ncbi:hypothetical protein FRC01_005461 [Tulasnella sp. 417]|nr:hypothetical protein FRC01_005461 [Tulasnella sp. 417]
MASNLDGVIKAKVSALSAEILEVLRSSQSLPDPETPHIHPKLSSKRPFAYSPFACGNPGDHPIQGFNIRRLPQKENKAPPCVPYLGQRDKFQHIDVLTTLSTDDPPSQHDRLLQMSRQLPVTIYMSYQSLKSPPPRKLMETVRSKVLTLREVVFIGYDSKAAEGVLTNCLFAPGPHLRSLDIAVSRGWTVQDEDSSSQHAQIKSLTAPNLTSVRLCGVYMPWSAAILRGLHSLSLERLNRSGGTRNSPTRKELVEILQDCPSLRCLTLRFLTLCPEDGQEAPARISLNELRTINLSGRSLRPTCDILQYIQYPVTTTVSIGIDTRVLDDDWQVDLDVVLSQLPENRIIPPLHLKIGRPCLTLSAINFQLTIPSPNEDREISSSRMTYKELFSIFDTSTLAAVTSLHLDSLASQNSTPILMAANEFFSNLTKLSTSSYNRVKSKKPWHLVLEKAILSTDEVDRPMYLCPKLTSLEIGTPSGDCPDLVSILQLVRIRSSNRKFKGKQVRKSPITSIGMSLESDKLSAEQLGLLNELKDEVNDETVDCIHSRETKPLETGMEPKQDIKAKVSALSAQVLKILSLPDPETPYECILNEIAARQTIFSEVQSQICALKSRQNELLPIHLLPEEVLAIILFTALPLSHHHKGRTRLLLVCRTWTKVINTNPSMFWTTLSADDPPSQYDRLLRMSRQMPIAIRVDLHPTDPVSSSRFLNFIRSKRITLREVVFLGSVDPLVEQVLRDWLFTPAPHLRSLELVAYNSWELQDGYQVPMDSLAAPNLTRVRFSQVSIPWHAASLRGLHSLSLEHLDGPTLEELVGMLQHSPNLQYLTLLDVGFCPDDQREAPTHISLNKLVKINLSFRSPQSASDILHCIQFPRTASVSVNIHHLTPDNSWQVDLSVVLSLLRQNRIIAPINLKLHRPRMTLSAANFNFTIPSPTEERDNKGSRITSKELFSSLGAHTLSVITSLQIDTLAGQNATAILMAANEFLPNLSKLSIPPYQRRKSQKPWHVVLEKVIQSAEDTNRPMCLCPKLTSLEITSYGYLLDLPSILQLVRIRSANRKLKGKEVEKSHITSIHITLSRANLSAQQAVVLNELKGAVSDVQCVSTLANVATQHDSDAHTESESSPSQLVLQ